MPDAFIDAAGERLGRDNYEKLRTGILSMKERALEIEPVPGGLLDREDQRTDLMPLSHQVKWHLQVAAHHLQAFDRLVQSEDTLPTYSGYALIRACIESAAQAHWLIHHEHSAKRVLRALLSAWWDHRDAVAFARSLDRLDEDWDKRVREGLDAKRAAVKSLRQTSLDVPRTSHTDMLIDVERRLILPAPTPLTTWRLCSSLTHGNSSIATMALQRRVLDEAAPHVHSATSSWLLVSALVRSTVETFDAAVALLRRRAQTL
ncbi:MAG: hypothetical protein K0S70_795 [Microbacterium sp.]|nr:hypothetical protein [Microbacterium sp.]